MAQKAAASQGSVRSVLKNEYDIRSGVYSAIDNSIEMRLNEYGEYTTILTESATNSRSTMERLSRVSAMSNESLDESTVAKNLFAPIPNIEFSDVIGYHLGLFAGHVIEGNYRKYASSGGFTTWLLKELLERRLIDGVIHVKRSTSKTVLFEYGISTTIQQVRDNAKTRYYPAELSGALNQIRNMPGKYAITGIPSFIMEVRLLASQDPEIGKKIAYTFGLICGHQKSTKYAESLAWQSGIKPGNLVSIDFRKKIPGSPANKYATEMTGIINGKEVTVTKRQEELFGSHWGHGFFKTKLSDYTDDALNETADVALGDAWLPEYTRDGLGNNILIVRNQKILSIIQDGAKRGLVKIDILTADDIIKSQPGLIHHTRDDLPYRLFKKDAANEWRPIKRVSPSNKVPYLRKKVQDIREEIREKSHTNYRRAVELDDWSYFERSMRPLLRRYSLLYVLVQTRRRGLAWFIKKALKH